MRALALTALMAMTAFNDAEPGEAPVALRMDSFVVAPAHMPPATVVVKNLRQTPYQGTVRLRLPDGWIGSPPEQTVSLGPGETGAVRFTIVKGRNSESNRYPVEIIAIGGGTTVTHRQNVSCASAPYFAPEIDGHTDEWADAIPVTFDVSGKNTVISTYWSRRQFSILIAVEEDEWIPFGAGRQNSAFDAVQLAISPQTSEEEVEADDVATRYEFLLAGTSSGTAGHCFQLATPGTKLSDLAEPRPLGPLDFAKAKLVVRRDQGVTYYECAIPFRSLKGIRPSEGREFFLSVLVHDPDGTGLRDWGAAAGLFLWERNRKAWADWPGARWPEQPPFDNKTPWGLCSSKY